MMEWEERLLAFMREWMLTTYPDQEGGLHETCCDMESRGLIRRRNDKGDSVTWEAK